MAKASAWFFKTGPGQYAEGDRFIGVRVPVLRKLAREFRDLPLTEAERLLHSSLHEERLLALLILTGQAARGDQSERQSVYELYLENTAYVNNWDLVDASAPQIVGGHLVDRSRRPLDRLVRSRSLWERRIAIVGTHYFIRQNDFGDTLRLSERLLTDDHDLIHKAVGWMLREVGKRDRPVLTEFLDRNASRMPRVMLRYSIEHYPERQRLAFLRSGRCD